MDDKKPSRTEDEYFVKQDAELIKAQRQRLDAQRATPGAQVALHEVPQVRAGPGGDRLPPHQDRSVSRLPRRLVRRRRSGDAASTSTRASCEASSAPCSDSSGNERHPTRRRSGHHARRSSPSTASRRTSTIGSSPCSDATPTFTELGRGERAVERALLVQAFAPAAPHAAHHGAVRAAGPGRKRRRHLRR